jgi:hypothetical protein
MLNLSFRREVERFTYKRLFALKLFRKPVRRGFFHRSNQSEDDLRVAGLRTTERNAGNAGLKH